MRTTIGILLVEHLMSNARHIGKFGNTNYLAVIMSFTAFNWSLARKAFVASMNESWLRSHILFLHDIQNVFFLIFHMFIVRMWIPIHKYNTKYMHISWTGISVSAFVRPMNPNLTWTSISTLWFFFWFTTLFYRVKVCSCVIAACL